MAIEKIVQTGTPNRLGSRIRKLRTERKLKQVDIMREMQLKGLAVTSYSYTRIEQGKINPTLDFIIALVEILDIDYNMLFDFDK